MVGQDCAFDLYSPLYNADDAILTSPAIKITSYGVQLTLPVPEILLRVGDGPRLLSLLPMPFGY